VSIHIPKCAGSSLHVALKETLGDRLKSDYGNQVVLADLWAIQVRRKKSELMLRNLHTWNGIDVIHGHFYARKYIEAPFDKNWVTFVRHPFELLVSYYHFLKRKNKGTLCEIAAALTLDEFIEHPFFSNIITRLTYPLRPSDFTFVGFAESYPQSVAAFSGILGVPLREVSRNANPGGSKYRDTLDAAQLKSLEKLNALDLEWYQEALAWASSAGLPFPADGSGVVWHPGAPPELLHGPSSGAPAVDGAALGDETAPDIGEKRELSAASDIVGTPPAAERRRARAPVNRPLKEGKDAASRNQPGAGTRTIEHLNALYLRGEAPTAWEANPLGDPRLFVLLKNKDLPAAIDKLEYMRNFGEVFEFAFDAIARYREGAGLREYRDLYFEARGARMFAFRKAQIILELLADRIAAEHQRSRSDAAMRDNPAPMLFQFWDRNPPPEVAANLSGWTDFASDNGYQHLVFNLDSASSFIADSFGSEFVDAFRTARHPAIQADVFRILYAYRNGGCWIDADLEPPSDSATHEFHKITQGTNFLFLRRHSQPTLLRISNMFFALAPGHPLLARMVSEISEDSGESWSRGGIVVTTGPGLWTRAFVETILLSPSTKEDGQQIRLPHRVALGPLPWKGANRKKYEYKKTAHWSTSRKSASSGSRSAGT